METAPTTQGRSQRILRVLLRDVELRKGRRLVRNVFGYSIFADHT